MKESKLIAQIAGKLVVEGLTHDVATKETAIQFTLNCVGVIRIHHEIETNFEEIIKAMSTMTVNQIAI